MQTLKLTAKDFKETDYYYKEYIGKEDVSNYDGHIEIESGLGCVKFERLSANGMIIALAGTGIEAGYGIEAGLYISCKLSLSTSLRIFAGTCNWRSISEDEKTITCGKLESGEIAYGILNETGLEETVEELTMEEVCKELGRNIKIKK